MNLFAKQKQRHRYGEQMFGHQGGKLGNRVDWEMGLDIYTLLCIKQTTNENILQSTGNSTQLCGDLNEEEIQKRRHMCTIVDSLCCTTETNAELLGNYVSIKIKIKKKRMIDRDSNCVFPPFPCCGLTVFFGFKYF